jgi:tetratricopeptide (TPR) repeat protein
LRSSGQTLTAFQSGDLSRAVELTRAQATPRERIARGRALLRLECAREALSAVDFDTSSCDATISAERSLVAATAYGRLGRFYDAEDALLTARAFGFSTPFRALEMDIYVHQASLALMSEDLAEAARSLESAMDVENRSHVHFSDIEPFFDEDHVLARLFELSAFLAAANHDSDAAEAAFAQALEHATKTSTPDAWLVANIASNYALALAERTDAEGMPAIEEVASTIEWTHDMKLQRFHIHRSMASAAALSGNHVVAFREYRKAASYAPSAVYRVQAMIDRAYLSRELDLSKGELFLDDLGAIEAMAAEIDWDRAIGEEYVALLMLAQLFAPHDAAKAASYFAMYTSAHVKSSRNLSSHYHPRHRALVSFTAGLISLREGDATTALAKLEAAFALYAEAGCMWRAAAVALELLQLSEATEYRSAAAKIAERIPHSWIARRFNALSFDRA